MSDKTYDEKTIKKIMKSNKSKDTGPEIKLRKALFKKGIRGYRKNYDKAQGKPDVAFVGKKIAIFINGCFWHGCEKCNKTMPKRNKEYWQEKVENNKKRDIRNKKQLTKKGWKVYTIWECEIRENLDGKVNEIEKLLDGSK